MPIYKLPGKKNGLQKYRVVVSYTTPAGEYKKREKIAYGIDDARATEAILEKDKKISPAAKITVGQLVDEYLTAQRSKIRETSLHSLEGKIKRYISPYLTNDRIDRLTPASLQEWKNKLADSGISISACKKGYGALRGLLNFAIKLEYIPSNPLTKIGNFHNPLDFEIKKDFDFYTSEEFVKYIAVAKAKAEKSNNINDWGFHLFFMIAFFTGMRKGEINALKWSDIDGNIIQIRHSIAQKLKGGDRETPPKNKSSVRDIIASKMLMKALEEHKERQGQVVGVMDSFIKNDDWRVCGYLRPLRDSTIDTRNRKYAELAGIKRIRIHHFRHSHASLLANNGISIMEISRRLGHRNIQETLDTYSHLYPHEEQKALKVLDAVLLSE